MRGTAEGLLTMPGGALVTLEELRSNSAPARTALTASVAAVRARTDLADLRTIARLCLLPMPRMVYNTLCGVVGTFRGTDKEIEYAVREWAVAFNVEPVIVEPGPWKRYPTSVPAFTTGWAVVSGSVGGLHFTVGGRLVEAVNAR